MSKKPLLAYQFFTKPVHRHWKSLFAFRNDSFLKIINLCILKYSFSEYTRSVTHKFWNDRIEKHIAIKICLSKDLKVLFMAACIFTAVMNRTHSPKPKAEDFPLTVRSPEKHTSIIPAIKVASTWCIVEQI